MINFKINVINLSNFTLSNPSLQVHPLELINNYYCTCVIKNLLCFIGISLIVVLLIFALYIVCKYILSIFKPTNLLMEEASTKPRPVRVPNPNYAGPGPQLPPATLEPTTDHGTTANYDY